MDQLVQNLSFEAVAVPQDNVSKIYTANISPIKVKIKIKKGWKNNSGIQQGLATSIKPKMKYINGHAKKIRKVQSDQTIMSFNMLMELESTSKTCRKSQNKFFHLFKTDEWTQPPIYGTTITDKTFAIKLDYGKCLGTQNEDEDDPPYIPANPIKSNEVETKRLTTGSENLNNHIRSANKSDIQTYTKIYKTPPIFLGKCKPGGCLDPPFGEDKYKYQPPAKSRPEEIITEKENKNIKIVNIRQNDKDKITKSSKNVIKIPDQDKTDTSTLMLYKASCEKIILYEKFSPSILTYPPDVSCEDLSISKELIINTKTPTAKIRQLSNNTETYFGKANFIKSQDKKIEINNNNQKKYIQKAGKNRTDSSLLDKSNIRIKENKVITTEYQTPEMTTKVEYKLLESVKVSDTGNQLSKHTVASTRYADKITIKSEIEQKDDNNYFTTSIEGVDSEMAKIASDKTSLLNIKNNSSCTAGHEFDINKLKSAHNQYATSHYGNNTKRLSCVVQSSSNSFKLDDLRTQHLVEKKEKIIENGPCVDNNLRKKYEHTNDVKDKQCIKNHYSVQENSKNELRITKSLYNTNNTSKVQESKLKSSSSYVIEHYDGIDNVKNEDHKLDLNLPKSDENLGDSHMKISNISYIDKENSKRHESLEGHCKNIKILELFDIDGEISKSHETFDCKNDPSKKTESMISVIPPKYNLKEKIIPRDSEYNANVFDIVNTDEISGMKSIVHAAHNDKNPSAVIENILIANQYEHLSDNLIKTIKPYATEYTTRNDLNVNRNSESLINGENCVADDFFLNLPVPEEIFGKYDIEVLDIIDNDKKNDKKFESHEDYSEEDRSKYSEILTNNKISNTNIFNTLSMEEINDKKIVVSGYADPSGKYEYSGKIIQSDHHKSYLTETSESGEITHNTGYTKSRISDLNVMQNTENITHSKANDGHEMIINLHKNNANMNDKYHSNILDNLDFNIQKGDTKHVLHDDHHTHKKIDITAKQNDNHHYKEIVDTLSTHKKRESKPQNETHAWENFENNISTIRAKIQKDDVLDNTISFDGESRNSLVKSKNSNSAIQNKATNRFSETITGSGHLVAKGAIPNPGIKYISTDHLIEYNSIITIGDKEKLEELETKQDKVTNKDSNFSNNSDNCSLISLISVNADTTLSNVSTNKKINLPDSKEGMVQSLLDLFESDKLLIKNVSKDILPEISAPVLTDDVKDVKNKCMTNESCEESLKQSESNFMKNIGKNAFSNNYETSVIDENMQHKNTKNFEKHINQILPIAYNNMLQHNAKSTDKHSKANNGTDVLQKISKQTFRTIASNVVLDPNAHERQDLKYENKPKIFREHSTKIAEILSEGEIYSFKHTVHNTPNASKSLINIKISEESKSYCGQFKDYEQNKSKNPLENDIGTTVVDLGFQTYVNEENEIILKTFNVEAMPERWPQDNIIMIKSALTLNDNSLSFYINPDIEITITINKNNILTKPEEKVIEIQDHSSDEIIHRIDKKEINVTDIRTLQKSLSVIYENDLVPVERLIKTVRLEIEQIVKYRSLVKKKHMITKKLKYTCPYKKCRCSAKYI